MVDHAQIRPDFNRFFKEGAAWLLENEHPSIRYWALVDLLDRPTGDPEVAATRESLSRQPLVVELFGRQQAGGHWGEEPTRPYSAAGTLGVLSLLHSLGVPPDERTTAGCDAFLRYSQHPEGGFSMVGTRRSGIFPCTTGQSLPFLIYFGLAEDPRVEKACAFLLAALSRPGPLNCARYQRQPCLWGAIAALDGLQAFPPHLQRNAPYKESVLALGETLLSAAYDFEGEHKRWLTFAVPRGWDLLRALLVLAGHGFGRDPRFAPLLDLVLAQRDRDGWWRCGSSSRTWPLEKRGQPSKWVTLDGLRLLKMVLPEAEETFHG